MYDDYEDIRRRQTEERREKREEERKKRREKLGITSTTARPRQPSKSANTTTTRNDDNESRIDTDTPENPRNRIEKLKEEKRAEEGLRLIQEMYGTKYLNADDIMKNSLHDSPAKAKPKPKNCEFGISPLSQSQSQDMNIDNDLKISAKRPSSWSSNGNKSRLDSYAKPQGALKPSSSLPMPKKAAPSPNRMKLVWAQNDDSSSDDCDLVALAQKLQNKKKLSPQQRMSTTYNSMASAKKEKSVSYASPKRNMNISDDSSDDDLMKSAFKIKAKQDAISKRAFHDDSSNQNATAEKSYAKKQDVNDSGSDEDLVS